MNMKLKLVKTENSTGIVLPEELLTRLGVQLGDTIFASETPDGVRLSVFDPDFEAKLSTAKQIMREDHAILRNLSQ